MGLSDGMKQALMFAGVAVGNKIKNPYLRYGLMGVLLWQMISLARKQGSMSGLPGGWQMSLDTDMAIDMFAPSLGGVTRMAAKRLAREFVKGMKR
jgi:hypothetical protein